MNLPLIQTIIQAGILVTVVYIASKTGDGGTSGGKGTPGVANPNDDTGNNTKR